MEAIFSFVATPFGYIMRLIYGLVSSYGASIILFAILAKVVTLPLTIKQKRSMQHTQRIQPRVQALQRKYGKDQQKLNAELQALYEKEGVSPMGGCGTTLLSLPIMIGLYYVISKPLSYFMQLSADQIAQVAERLGMEATTNQITLAGAIYDNFPLIQDISDKILQVDFHFLGLDLASTPHFKTFNLLWFIPILSGLTAFGFSMFQRRLNNRNNPTAAAANDQMTRMANSMIYMMPLISVYLGFILPAGLGVYWMINNVLSSIQEYFFSKFLKPLPVLEAEPPRKKKKPRPKPELTEGEEPITNPESQEDAPEEENHHEENH